MGTLASRLTNLREKKDWTKTAVAKKLGLKTVSTYANWEYGTREPDAEMIARIAKLHNVTTDYIISGIEHNYWELNKKEKKDIGKQIENIIEGIENEADINFYGEPMSDEDKELLASALEIGLRMSKEKAKKKFTPKKYRKDD